MKVGKHPEDRARVRSRFSYSRHARVTVIHEN
jgi:hypothetical protein